MNKIRTVMEDKFPNAVFPQKTMELEVSSARVLSADLDERKIIIELDDVQPVNIDWPAVGEVLKAAGVVAPDQLYLVEMFAQMTEQHLLAKVFADRLRRVG